MKKKIQRKTDNKYLISFEEDTWTENVENATVFTKPNAFFIMMKLNKTYKPSEINIV